MNILKIIFSVSFGFSVLRVTTPILFAALATLISDKVGIMNIGLEGIMLTSALTGVIVSTYTQSVLLGVAGAVVAGIFFSLVLTFFAVNLNTNVFLTGIALNMAASGGTVFVLFLVAHDMGTSSSMKSKVVPNLTIPLIKDIPVLGPILSGHNILTYISLLCVILIYILVYKTPLGIRIRAVGENSGAVSSAGLNVRRVQYIALSICGALAGLGGAFMSMGYVSWFARDMVSGRGFIALAAEAMGRGTPVGTLISSLIFGFADALSNSLQVLHVPAQFVQMIPYVTTIVGITVYSAQKTIRAAKKAGSEQKA